MATRISIQLKALFLLLVFTIGWIALCHCKHVPAAPKATAEKHGCCEKKEAKNDQQENAPCHEEDGRCKYKGIEFNSLAKQMAENISPNPVFFSFVVQHLIEPAATFFSPISIYQLPPKEKWRTRQTPDLLILKQSFLI